MKLKEQYPITNICEVLDYSKSSFYYKQQEKLPDIKTVLAIINIHELSTQTYGTPRMQRALRKLGIEISQRQIGKIMQDTKLVVVHKRSNCPKQKKQTPIEASIPNLLNNKYKDRKLLEIVLSDLTFIRVGAKWYYLCCLEDVFSRKIIGFAFGPKKDAKLALKAFYSTEVDLNDIQILHTDWGSEFNNVEIEELLTTFKITRSLSAKATPTDNSMMESLNATIKTEFANRHKFSSLSEFMEKWLKYLDWYNNHRLHSGIDYLTPSEKFKKGTLYNETKISA